MLILISKSLIVQIEHSIQRDLFADGAVLSSIPLFRGVFYLFLGDKKLWDETFSSCSFILRGNLFYIKCFSTSFDITRAAELRHVCEAKFRRFNEFVLFYVFSAIYESFHTIEKTLKSKMVDVITLNDVIKN